VAPLSWFFSKRRRVGWVTGAALVMRTSLFESAGRFDEEMFMYYEDKDICARAWSSGFEVVYDPSCSLIHLKGGSSPEDLSPFLRSVYRASQRRYYAKHRPAYEQKLLDWYQHMHG
jgi:GT2 family glycosyltransferase